MWPKPGRTWHDGGRNTPGDGPARPGFGLCRPHLSLTSAGFGQNQPYVARPQPQRSVEPRPNLVAPTQALSIPRRSWSITQPEIDRSGPEFRRAAPNRPTVRVPMRIVALLQAPKMGGPHGKAKTKGSRMCCANFDEICLGEPGASGDRRRRRRRIGGARPRKPRGRKTMPNRAHFWVKLGITMAEHGQRCGQTRRRIG